MPCRLTQAESPSVTISVTVDRGRDMGQSFGSLFEAESDDGSLTLGAGFQNLYNTRYRGDRHALQIFVRSTDGRRMISVEELPRPNDLCGTYLFARDGVVHSTYGGMHLWDRRSQSWHEEPSIGGTGESMRLGDGLLEFGASVVKYNGRTILGAPERGRYQLFFYANGQLCFYHVDRGERGYRPHTSDDDGFSKLYACPWTPDDPAVDLRRAAVYTLPIVGEMTFAWGQLGEQIVTGSNIGGFYVFANGSWRMLLEPDMKVSYQLYSSLGFEDRLLMGQYPTGRLFEYDGQAISELADWPPVLHGVSGSAREAQTSVIYGGEVLVGVWPWAELWRYNPDDQQWRFAQRMFDHPRLGDNITHPYDAENRDNEVGNLWGQRITSLVAVGRDLFVSTSAKSPVEWDPKKNPFLAPDKWRSYGAVYRLSVPGHLSVPTKWTDGPTTFDFTIGGSGVTIVQDGRQLGEMKVEGELGESLSRGSDFAGVEWGTGIYGPFGGRKIEGTVRGAGE